MRKLALLAAAVPLAALPLFGPGARAHGGGSDQRPVCPMPTLTTDYDVHQLTVHVSLPAGRCAAREQVFDLGVAVTRMDNHGSHDTLRSATRCGPFRSAGDVDPGEAAPDDSCGLGMAVDHPPVEAAQYVIDVTYPGAAGDETATDVVFCRSGSGKASCEQFGHAAMNGQGHSLAGAVGQRVVLAVAIAVSVVVIGGWTGRTGSPAEVTVLRGTVNTVNVTGTAIGFEGKRVAGPRLRISDVDGGWVVAGASWFDGRSWHDHDTPTCLQGGLAQPVELGVVEAAASDDAPGRAVVVWLKCLRTP